MDPAFKPPTPNIPPERPFTTSSTPGNLTEEQHGFVVLPQGGEITPKNPFKKILRKIHSLSKKQKIIFAVVSAVVILGASGGAYALFINKPAPQSSTTSPTPSPVVKPEPKPTTEASKLTGIQVKIGTNKRPVTSIQIENSPDARPQAGLRDAGVVFEAIAEGGITRFNASFMESEPSFIGPVRSVRPYYADLVAPFDPIFVHAGGSEAGIRRLTQLKIKDLDHGANGSAFERISERFAPHNLFTNMKALEKASEARGFKTSDTKSFERKKEQPASTPKVNKISMNISGYLYNTSYSYDAKSNKYKRSLAGAPHKDWKSGKQITPKVLVAIATQYGNDGIYSQYKTTGSGDALIFQDGKVHKVTWTKKSVGAQFVFKDKTTKKTVGLNPGQTWITLLKNIGEVTYSP